MRLYLEKRSHIKVLSRLPVLMMALLLAILMSFLILVSVGVNPIEAYSIVGEEIFFTSYGWQDLLVKITPLLLTGSAVALAAQMKLWNIGAEGQFHMGTFAVTWGALNFGYLDAVTLIPFLLILSILGGGLWGCIPGLLKSQFGVNEIITSLLLNYVAAAWIDYHLFGEWRGEEYFVTTKKLRGTENTIGANALIATHGVQVPLDTSDTAVERFYTSYSPADKRYFGTYAISPDSPFSLFQKKSFEGAVEFESPGNSIAATALHRVLDYPDGVVPSQGLGEFTLLKSAANQQYRQRVDDQREAVHKALRKVFKK